MVLKLWSNAFQNGEKIPARFTCDGANASPPLSWSGAPGTVRSFAIVCSDPDAPGGTFYHWAIFDIPRSTTQLTEQHATSGAGSREARNDFGKWGYGGPCPPHGHGIHHYRFRLFALDIERLPVGQRATSRDVQRIAIEHALAESELVGVYAR